jgi:mannose-1-phosphate guanylyltransferase
MIVFKDYSVDRKGEMKHASEYSSEEWVNARDRRRSRRKEEASQASIEVEKISEKVSA